MLKNDGCARMAVQMENTGTCSRRRCCCLSADPAGEWVGFSTGRRSHIFFKATTCLPNYCCLAQFPRREGGVIKSSSLSWILLCDFQSRSKRGKWGKDTFTAPAPARRKKIQNMHHHLLPSFTLSVSHFNYSRCSSFISHRYADSQRWSYILCAWVYMKALSAHLLSPPVGWTVVFSVRSLSGVGCQLHELGHKAPFMCVRVPPCDSGSCVCVLVCVSVCAVQR